MHVLAAAIHVRRKKKGNKKRRFYSKSLATTTETKQQFFVSTWYDLECNFASGEKSAIGMIRWSEIRRRDDDTTSGRSKSRCEIREAEKRRRRIIRKKLRRKSKADGCVVAVRLIGGDKYVMYKKGKWCWGSLATVCGSSNDGWTSGDSMTGWKQAETSWSLILVHPVKGRYW